MTNSPQNKKGTHLREYFDSLVVTVILALFGTTFVLQAFKIPSSSMEDTLLIGDHLLVNKFAYANAPGAGKGLLPYRKVRRGDIVVFKYPQPPHQHFVKRVIGLPGERLRITERQVFINGEPLVETYKVHRDHFTTPSFRDNFPPPDSFLSHEMAQEWLALVRQYTSGDELVIPPNRYFVMGDNRDRSADSRYWGFIDCDNIVGRPLLIYWSFGGNPRRYYRSNGFAQRLLALWDAVVHFFSRTRWERLLRPVR